MKKSSVYSQELRIKQLCSYAKDCKNHLKYLKNAKNVSREELIRKEETGTLVPHLLLHITHTLSIWVN